MTNEKNILEFLLLETKKELAETYEEALDNCFQYFLEKEYEDDNYDVNTARAEFKESTYYFLTFADFESIKLETLQEFKNDAHKELIKLIDRTDDIDDLRKAKKIYDNIIKIVDSNQLEFDNDCKLVLFN